MMKNDIEKSTSFRNKRLNMWWKVLEFNRSESINFLLICHRKIDTFSIIRKSYNHISSHVRFFFVKHLNSLNCWIICFNYLLHPISATFFILINIVDISFRRG